MAFLKMTACMAILPFSIFAMEYDSFIGARTVGSKTHAYHLEIKSADPGSVYNIVNNSDVIIRLFDKYNKCIILEPGEEISGQEIDCTFKLHHNECIYFSYLKGSEIIPFHGRCLGFDNLKRGDKLRIFHDVNGK